MEWGLHQRKLSPSYRRRVEKTAWRIRVVYDVYSEEEAQRGRVMPKLKGQTESGEWVEFNISQVYDICLHDNRWCIKGYPNDYVIDAATIMLADDQRKHPMFTVSCYTCAGMRFIFRMRLIARRFCQSSKKWRPSCE